MVEHIVLLLPTRVCFGGRFQECYQKMIVEFGGRSIPLKSNIVRFQPASSKGVPICLVPSKLETRTLVNTGCTMHLTAKGPCHSFVNFIEITLCGGRSTRKHLRGGKAEGGAVPNRPALARQHQEVTQPADGLEPDKSQDSLVPGGSGVKFGSPRFDRSGMVAVGGSDDPKGSGNPVGFKIRECV